MSCGETSNPKIYHIVHVDRLPHIVTAEYLYADASMQMQQGMGTTIGMSSIKTRRLTYCPHRCKNTSIKY